MMYGTSELDLICVPLEQLYDATPVISPVATLPGAADVDVGVVPEGEGVEEDGVVLLPWLSTLHKGQSCDISISIYRRIPSLDSRARRNAITVLLHTDAYSNSYPDADSQRSECSYDTYYERLLGCLC